MLETIMMICGWAVLVCAIVLACSLVPFIKSLKSEDVELRAKATPALFLGSSGLFLSGAAWLVCWLISLFV